MRLERPLGGERGPCVVPVERRLQVLEGAGVHEAEIDAGRTAPNVPRGVEERGISEGDLEEVRQLVELGAVLRFNVVPTVCSDEADEMAGATWLVDGCR